MNKIYARQILVEDQDSSQEIKNCLDGSIALFTKSFNDWQEDKLPEAIKKVRFEIWEDNILDHILDEDGDPIKFIDERAVVEHFLPPQKDEPYSYKDWNDIIYHLVNIDKDFKDKDNDWLFCKMCTLVSIVTGKKWDYRMIKGRSEDDWAYVAYDTSVWNDDKVHNFEIAYFNMGTEWIIHDGDDNPTTPDDIAGHSVYCHSTDVNDIRNEIATLEGCNPDDVVMYSAKIEYYTAYTLV